jgi:zinc transport system substrate-binding protein
MKKYILTAILLCLGTFILMGCGSGNNSGFSETDKISVVTTIYPMQDFVEHIAGDKAEVINLVPAGTEPHDFELSAKDMTLLEQADLFVYNGAGMEHFVDKTLASLSNRNLMVVEAAENVTLLEAGEQQAAEEQNDGNHEEEQYDPHTWLSIDNAIVELEAVKDAFCKLDADNEDYYTANFEAYRQELLDLKAEYEQELSGFSKNKIVVAHEAFGYLCQEYGLEQIAVEGLTSDSEPDAARMREIVDLCREYDIQVIFFEELVSPKVANTIAEEIGAATKVLNPIEGRTASQEEEGVDYVTLMRQNLAALKEALE